MTQQAKHREADCLVRSVATFIDEESLIAPGAGGVVGVSGEADADARRVGRSGNKAPRIFTGG